MSIVPNSSASASSASFNLSRANRSLQTSLERLSSEKKINRSGDDSDGMAVAYELHLWLSRIFAVRQITQNSLSYLQVQDGALSTISKIMGRMSELRKMANDATKNSSDAENYSKGFVAASGLSNSHDNIGSLPIGTFVDAIERITDAQAENGAEQHRLKFVDNFLVEKQTNLQAAHGRIMDTDIAAESTRFERSNILVQSSASMTAQSNQLSSLVLTLIE